MSDVLPFAPTRRVYAVGDVHGRLDLLDDLLERVRDDIEVMPDLNDARPLLVFLGDYMDRGPQGIEVLRRLHRLATGEEVFPAEIICLGGNHEQMLFDALRGERGAWDFWMKYGGDAVAREVGYSRFDPPSLVISAVTKAIGDDIIVWLSDLPNLYHEGDFVFVHAGVDPRVSLEEQDQDTVIWTRDERHFLITLDLPYVVVHGHTIIKDPVVDGCRINVDTGSVKYGQLTAARIDRDGTVAFLQAQDPEMNPHPVR